MSMAEVVETHSPSMDIQISSNFERLAFESAGRDAAAIDDTMKKFRETGKMPIPNGMWDKINEQFQGMSVNNDDTLTAIKKWKEKTDIIFDPHSVIGLEAGMYENFITSGGNGNRPPSKILMHYKKQSAKKLKCSHMADMFDREEKYDIWKMITIHWLNIMTII